MPKGQQSRGATRRAKVKTRTIVPTASTPFSGVPVAPAAKPCPAAVAFNACAAPTARTAPEFTISFRRPIVLLGVSQYSPSTTPTPATLACVQVSNASIELGLDPRFEQLWSLQELAIGDLASTMSLAPAEQLTLEFTTSQRKVLDRRVLESTESITSTESTTADKEAVNITRASSKTENWHVDTTGTLTCGYASLSVTAGYSQSITNSNQQAVNHISEATKKSAHSLKSLHTIEVRGISEGIVTHRMTRTLRNPYFDRTLSVNVFQLVKRYCVTTSLTETRTAIIIQVGSIVFDDDFVRSNGDFLASSLLDTPLRNDLATAMQGTGPLLSPDVQRTAGEIARRALHMLFDDPNLFNIPPKNGVNANLPQTSFNASIANWDDTGLRDAIHNHLGVIFSILSCYYALTRDVDPVTKKFVIDIDDAAAIRLAVALASDVGSKWNAMYPDLTKDAAATDIRNVMDADNFTEIFRRVPGFLSIVGGSLTPLLEPVKQEAEEQAAQRQAAYVLGRLVKHLNCNTNYYIQEFLRYLADVTNMQAISDFANRLLTDATVTAAVPNANEAFDVSRAFINRQEIIIPAFNPLTSADIAALGSNLNLSAGEAVSDPGSSSVDIEVPCDGIHLEVAAGACVLASVPVPGDKVSVSLQNASFGVNV